MASDRHSFQIGSHADHPCNLQTSRFCSDAANMLRTYVVKPIYLAQKMPPKGRTRRLPRPPRFLWWCRWTVRDGTPWRGCLKCHGWAMSRQGGLWKLPKVLSQMPRGWKGTVEFGVHSCALRRTRAQVEQARRRDARMIVIPAEEVAVFPDP